MKNLVFIILLLSSCSENNESNSQIIVNQSDSVLLHSQKLHDSVGKKLKIVDRIAEKKVSQVVYKINVLQNELNNIKSTMKITKSIVIHDTIYITEKKNFWGKSKVKIDSSKQGTIIDSSLNEN